MTEPLRPAPTALVNADGTVAFGVYNGPPRRVGLEDARWTAGGMSVPARLRSLRLKRWHHMLLVHPDVLITAAFVDAVYTKLSWVQVVDLKTGESFEHHHQSPRLNVRLPDALFDDRGHCIRPGYRIDVRDHLDAGRHTWRFDIAQRPKLPSVSGELQLLHPLRGPRAVQPLVVALPLGDGRAMYSHKVPLAVEGRLQVGDRTIDVSPDTCTAVLDIHQAHYPRHTWWRWATLACLDADGRRIAVNLTENIVRSSTLSENAIWCDGTVEHVGAALFHREADSATGVSRWRVGSKDSAVQLEFEPLGARSENLNLGVVASRFKQNYGRFHGTVRIAGVDTRIDGAYGLLEDHDSKW